MVAAERLRQASHDKNKIDLMRKYMSFLRECYHVGDGGDYTIDMAIKAQKTFIEQFGEFGIGHIKIETIWKGKQS